MAEFQLHHIHHEAADVDAAVTFYEKNFQAELEERTVRNGEQWARVRLGGTLLNISDRATTQVGLERYQGIDHFALHTSDFAGTVAALKANWRSLLHRAHVAPTGRRDRLHFRARQHQDRAHAPQLISWGAARWTPIVPVKPETRHEMPGRAVACCKRVARAYWD